jgi:hypothetical protein
MIAKGNKEKNNSERKVNRERKKEKIIVREK